MVVNLPACSLECIADSHVALVGRDVDELPMPGHVASRPHPGIRGLEIVTDLDRPEFGELDSGLLEAHALGVRPSSCRDQDFIDIQNFLSAVVLETDAPSAGESFDSDHLSIGDHSRALLFENSTEGLGGLWLFARRNFAAGDE